MWLACYTQEEIAEALGLPRETVKDKIGSFGENGNLSKSAKTVADHLTDFDPPIYNIWKQQEKSTALNHFGLDEVSPGHHVHHITRRHMSDVPICGR